MTELILHWIFKATGKTPGRTSYAALPPDCEPIHVAATVDDAKPTIPAAKQPPANAVPVAANPVSKAAAKLDKHSPPKILLFVVFSIQSLVIAAAYRIAHSSTYAQ